MARVLIGKVGVPVGAIEGFGNNTAPIGWLECVGQTVSRTTYASLFALIGTSFGAGDGVSTFHLPDLRSRFLRGRDEGSGRDPDAASRTASNAGGATGDNVGSVQDDAFQGHYHTTRGTLTESGIQNSLERTETGTDNNQTGQVCATTPSTGINGVPRTSNETRPVNITVKYYIKY